jgi:hypothetical protein
MVVLILMLAVLIQESRILSLLVLNVSMVKTGLLLYRREVVICPPLCLHLPLLMLLLIEVNWQG